MSARLASIAVTLRVYSGTDIADRIKPILNLLDQAARRAEGGHSDQHTINRQASIALHDLLAEVSE